ncbi:murein L,D-transpeptidase catalytic domain family protein [Dysgonomonas sp. 25]|uniref:murein L,D-transpeptidase catalytic domain family protein n=1 Tax=Dysgonomonas sp. 25 TaxID=2302933 RepID=UPI0013D304CA|nr:murein L,D-transpeptidase catalytic domain family protein [Dysgonomonas sp. 25]NDV68404.1 hypothetical protein [Dysgonomonas sp. 25]
MYKISLYLLLILFLIASPAYSDNIPDTPEEVVADSSSAVELTETQKLYAELQLDSLVNYNMFEDAMIGYNALDIPNKEIITLIDFSKPSTEERLYVLDLKEKKVLFTSHVAHGKNSGWNYATAFSNKMKSNKSSLGFFITGDTYRGKRGYSLTINGQEKGINDNARMRGVVFHGAKYANPALIYQGEGGRLGRSRGCPALPMDIYRPVIDTIKGGTMVFIYAENADYKKKSPILSLGE